MTPGFSTIALQTGKVATAAAVVWALQMPMEPEAATTAAAFNVSVSLQEGQITGCLNRSQVKSSNALVTVTCDGGQFVSISAVAVVPGAAFVSPLLSGQANSLMDGSRATLVSSATPGTLQAAGGTSIQRRQTGTVTASRAEPVVVNAPVSAGGTITSMRLNNATTEQTPVDLVVTF